MKKKVCAILADFTGTCAPKLDEALSTLLRELVEEGFGEVICGMERGLEQRAAAVVLRLRETLHLELCGLIDSEQQWLDWSLEERDRLFALMERADSEYRVSNVSDEEMLRLKQRFLTAEADALILLCSSLSGYAASLAGAMRLRGRTVLLLDPESLHVTRYLDVL